jgi:hypothetical protein
MLFVLAALLYLRKQRVWRCHDRCRRCVSWWRCGVHASRRLRSRGCCAIWAGTTAVALTPRATLLLWRARSCASERACMPCTQFSMRIDPGLPYGLFVRDTLTASGFHWSRPQRALDCRIIRACHLAESVGTRPCKCFRRLHDQAVLAAGTQRTARRCRLQPRSSWGRRPSPSSRRRC